MAMKVKDLLELSSLQPSASICSEKGRKANSENAGVKPVKPDSSCG